jgi:hypothetical protein
VSAVAAFSVAGLDFWFNSSDHLPPHFHAEKPGDWEVRVYFLRDRSEMFEVKWTKKKGRPRKKDFRAVGRATEQHRAELLVEWEQKVPIRTPGPAR